MHAKLESPLQDRKDVDLIVESRAGSATKSHDD